MEGGTVLGVEAANTDVPDVKEIVKRLGGCPSARPAPRRRCAALLPACTHRSPPCLATPAPTPTPAFPPDLWKIDQLYVIGGRGGNAGAQAIHRECVRSGVPCCVVAVPKSIGGWAGGRAGGWVGGCACEGGWVGGWECEHARAGRGQRLCMERFMAASHAHHPSPLPPPPLPRQTTTSCSLIRRLAQRRRLRKR